MNPQRAATKAHFQLLLWIQAGYLNPTPKPSHAVILPKFQGEKIRRNTRSEILHQKQCFTACPWFSPMFPLLSNLPSLPELCSIHASIEVKSSTNKVTNLTFSALSPSPTDSFTTVPSAATTRCRWRQWLRSTGFHHSEYNQPPSPLPLSHHSPPPFT